MDFSKYHGIGNDYIFIDAGTLSTDTLRKLAVTLSAPHTGIGSDGLVAYDTDDMSMRIFNPDGTEAEICGNALRCFALLMHERTGLTEITVRTLAGRRTLSVTDTAPFTAQVDMGRAEFDCARIPMSCSGTFRSQSLAVGGTRICATAVSVGNPHLVIPISEDIDDSTFFRLSPMLERHSLFPNRTNVEWVTVLDRHNVRVRVWERGAGETKACGSGAAAVAAVFLAHGTIDDYIDVHLAGGSLHVSQSGDSLIVSGTACHVYDGTITDDYLRMCL